MKVHEMFFQWWVRGALSAAVVVSLAASCAGASTPEAAPPVDEVLPTTIADEVETPNPEPANGSADEPTPTAASEPEPVVVSDEDRIAAAYAAFENEPEPAELIAWDFFEPTVDDNGFVLFTVCGWDGQSAFDQIYNAVIDTVAEDDGTITTRIIDVAPTAGECLNTTLVNSVIDFVNEFNKYYGEMLAEPDRFAADPRTNSLWTDEGFEVVDRYLLTLLEAGRASPASVFQASNLPQSALAPVLWRRYVERGSATVEIAVCEQMDPRFGVYVDDELVDDRKAGTVSGPHSITIYVLHEDVTGNGWRVFSTSDNVWGDCFRSGDWRAGMEQFRPGDVPWKEIAL